MSIQLINYSVEDLFVNIYLANRIDTALVLAIDSKNKKDLLLKLPSVYLFDIMLKMSVEHNSAEFMKMMEEVVQEKMRRFDLNKERWQKNTNIPFSFDNWLDLYNLSYVSDDFKNYILAQMEKLISKANGFGKREDSFDNLCLMYHLTKDEKWFNLAYQKIFKVDKSERADLAMILVAINYAMRKYNLESKQNELDLLAKVEPYRFNAFAISTFEKILEKFANQEDLFWDVGPFERYLKNENLTASQLVDLLLFFVKNNFAKEYIFELFETIKSKNDIMLVSDEKWFSIIRYLKPDIYFELIIFSLEQLQVFHSFEALFKSIGAYLGDIINNVVWAERFFKIMFDKVTNTAELAVFYTYYFHCPHVSLCNNGNGFVDYQVSFEKYLLNDDSLGFDGCVPFIRKQKQLLANHPDQKEPYFQEKSKNPDYKKLIFLIFDTIECPNDFRIFFENFTSDMPFWDDVIDKFKRLEFALSYWYDLYQYIHIEDLKKYIFQQIKEQTNYFNSELVDILDKEPKYSELFLWAQARLRASL